MSDALFRLRIAFVKQGRLVFLSHLELAGALERAIRRAGLPYAITNGFSPHMRIAFGPALGVGTGGSEEYLDVWLTEYVDPEEALARMKSASVEDLAPYDAFYVTSSEPSLTAALTRATYVAVLDTTPLGERALERLQSALDEVLAVGTIEVVRKNKTKSIDLSAKLPQVPFLKEEEEGSVTLVLHTLSAADGALRPEVFIAEVSEHLGCLLPIRSLTRTAQE